MHHLPNTTTQFIAREFINDYGKIYIRICLNITLIELIDIAFFRLDRKGVYPRKPQEVKGSKRLSFGTIGHFGGTLHQTTVRILCFGGFQQGKG